MRAKTNFSNSASWCWHNVSPAVVITFLYVWLICLASFIKAATSDPGVSKRAIKDFSNCIKVTNYPGHTQKYTSYR